MVAISKKLKKISIGYFFAAAVASLAFFYIGEYLIEIDTEKVALDNAEKKILERKKVFNEFVNQGVDDIRSIYENNNFRSYIHGDKLTKHQEQDLTDLFLILVKTQKYIMQFRILNDKGMEVIRIDRNNDQVSLVPSSQLQDKSHRDYFQNALKTKSPFYSALNLNIEHGTIEQPERVTLRIAAPLYDKEFRGVLVINFDMHKFIKKLTNAPLYDIVMFDEDGYTMYHFDAERSWGNSYPHHYNIKDDGYKDIENVLKNNRVYRGPNYVAKVFALDYKVQNGVGMLLQMSEVYKEDIQSHKTMYYAFYILTFLLAFVIPGLILKNYMTTILDYEKAKRYTEWLEYKQTELEEETNQDPLTGIGNRRRYEERMNELVEEYHRYNKVFSMVLIDLDDFKNINDTYSHDVGDEVLIAVSNLVKTYTRKSDTFVRFGGEEFAVFLPNTQLRNAVSFAEKIRKQISKMDLTIDNIDINITVSVGVDSIEADDNKSSFFKRVDDYMYESKNIGKNKVTYNTIKYKAEKK